MGSDVDGVYWQISWTMLLTGAKELGAEIWDNKNYLTVYLNEYFIFSINLQGT